MTTLKKGNLPAAPGKPANPALKSETWFVKLVYGASDREWTFSADGTVVEELRRAMIEGRPAHLIYAGTEAIINPAHIASVELQKQV
ncbi:MAG: hypothetical protein JWM80_4931 [Cyanobacteria bacterium RYN_339]|nr:hypothetical protein [Cyanobacteria bacterium RYN_339]